MSNKPIVVRMVKPTIQSRSKMTKLKQYSLETQVYSNEFSIETFKYLDVDNQMSLSCGQNEPHSCPKNAYFS